MRRCQSERSASFNGSLSFIHCIDMYEVFLSFFFFSYLLLKASFLIAEHPFALFGINSLTCQEYSFAKVDIFQAS